MRIPDNSFIFSYMNNLNKNRERIINLQTQLATGKRVLKSSDDPQATDSILRLERAIDRNEQYQRNISDGNTMMAVTDSALNAISNYIIEVKEVMTAAGNPTRSEELSVYAQRVDALISEIHSIATMKFNGKYIFGGTNTLHQPYSVNEDRTAVTLHPAGVGGTIEYPISDGIKQTVNINGEDAFRGTELFDILFHLRERLNAGEYPNEDDIKNVSAIHDTVLAQSSRVGLIMQSLENIELQLIEQQVHLRALLSIEQDVDVAESIMKLKNEELMLQASLQTGARVLPMTLLDFLR
jgi:flagellar hook-associated protein 3 FlgL